MTNILKKLLSFLSFWHYRYLLVTELYMVEPWEKVVVQGTMAAIFLLVWYFNYSVVMNGISQLRGTVVPVEQSGMLSA